MNIRLTDEEALDVGRRLVEMANADPSGKERCDECGTAHLFPMGLRTRALFSIAHLCDECYRGGRDE